MPYYSETSCEFFLGAFFSIRPTDPISENAFDAKQKKKGGMALVEKGIRFLSRAGSLECFVENLIEDILRLSEDFEGLPSTLKFSRKCS